MRVTESGITGDRDFPATSWSAIRHAHDPDSPEYQRQLRRLVELYWRPVYLVIRHGWSKSHEDAKDLTQQFYADVVFAGALVRSFAPERGSFRKLLRAAITNFMRNAVRDARRLKRGGEAIMLPLDDAELAAEELPGEPANSPEELFDRAWRRAVMSRVVQLLERTLVEAGKASSFEVFRRYELVDATDPPSYAEVGDGLGMSVPQVKHALRLARETFREIVTDVVRGYVDGPEELARELRGLLEG